MLRHRNRNKRRRFDSGSHLHPIGNLLPSTPTKKDACLLKKKMFIGRPLTTSRCHFSLVLGGLARDGSHKVSTIPVVCVMEKMLDSV